MMVGAVARGREESDLPRRTVSPLVRANARRLRRSMTGVEERLWAALRGHRFDRVSFRRQMPIGPYIADFCCHAARLVIEVDGGQHGEAIGAARDGRRDAWLAEAGYRVIRFWNHEVLAETGAVLDAIWFALSDAGVILADAEPPLPVPPPPGGRERMPRSPAVISAAAVAEGASLGSPTRSIVSDAASGVPSPLLEGEGQGGGAAASPPSPQSSDRRLATAAINQGPTP